MKRTFKAGRRECITATASSMKVERSSTVPDELLGAKVPQLSSRL